MKLFEEMMLENSKLFTKSKVEKNVDKKDSIDPKKTAKRSTEILNERSYEDRHYTNGILELVDEGVIDGAWLAEGLLKWMGEDDVEDFARVYELKELIDGEEEIDESVKKSIKEKFQKRLSEDLKLISDIGDYQPWSGAVETWDKIVQEGKVDTLDYMLEDIYPEGMTVTQLNDLLWFDSDWVFELLGISDIIGEHTYRVTNIVWDADEGDDIDELPSSYNVDIEVEEEDDDIEELVRDALENEFGFNASSFDFELDESLKDKKGKKRIKESVDEERPYLTVCDHCLQAIESHEGPQITKTIYVDDEEYFDSEEEYERESKCDWCEEYGFDTLYEIHGKGDIDFDESCHKGSKKLKNKKKIKEAKRWSRAFPQYVYTFDDGWNIVAVDEDEASEKYQDIQDNKYSGLREVEELDKVASALYDSDDQWAFNYFSDDELATLLALCSLSKERPYGAAYDDEVYDAIKRSPNKEKIFQDSYVIYQKLFHPLNESILDYNKFDDYYDDSDSKENLRAQMIQYLFDNGDELSGSKVNALIDVFGVSRDDAIDAIVAWGNRRDGYESGIEYGDLYEDTVKKSNGKKLRESVSEEPEYSKYVHYKGHDVDISLFYDDVSGQYEVCIGEMEGTTRDSQELPELLGHEGPGWFTDDWSEGRQLVNAWVKELEDAIDAQNLTEDTVKKSNGKWTNRGDTGKEHGEFKTKKAADAQRKAMYARGYKGESLKEEFDPGEEFIYSTIIDEPIYEEDKVYLDHDGMKCKIIRDIDNECYECKFEDGFIGECFIDELIPITTESKKRVTERNLTRSERHNRNMDRIFNTKKEQDKKFADFLRKNGYSEDEIKSLADADKLNAEIYSKFGGSKAVGDVLKESNDSDFCYEYKGYTICSDYDRGLWIVKELKDETFSTDTDAEDRIDSILDESLLKEKSYVKLGTDVGEYQEWVDYDMERYGRVSVETRRKLRNAGLTVVKDKYGDYEVISHDPIDYRKDRRDKFSKRSYKDDDLDESVDEEPQDKKSVGLTHI